MGFCHHLRYVFLLLRCVLSYRPLCSYLQAASAAIIPDSIANSNPILPALSPATYIFDTSVERFLSRLIFAVVGITVGKWRYPFSSSSGTNLLTLRSASASQSYSGRIDSLPLPFSSVLTFSLTTLSFDRIKVSCPILLVCSTPLFLNSLLPITLNETLSVFHL